MADSTLDVQQRGRVVTESAAATFRLAIATAVVFATHVASIAITPAIPVRADAEFYDFSAQSIVGGKGFQDGLRPEVSVMPGYSVFLAGIYGVWGHRLWAVYIVQSLLIALSACGIYLMLRRACGRRPAAIAFAAIALFPPWFIYAGMVSAEVLLLAVQILFFAVTLRSSRSVGWAAGSGAACGFMTLIKPEFVLWLPLSAILAGRARAAKVFAVSAVALAVVVSPWVIRNVLTFHQFIPLTTRSGRALWLSAHKPELTEFSAPEFVAADARCEMPDDPKGSDACLTAEARRMIANHPGYFLKTCAGRVFRTLVGSHTEALPTYYLGFGEALRQRKVEILCVKGILLAADVVFVAGGLLGIGILCRDRRRWFLLYLMGSKLAVCAVFFGTARYGLHLTPLFAGGWGALSRLRLGPASDVAEATQ